MACSPGRRQICGRICALLRETTGCNHTTGIGAAKPSTGSRSIAEIGPRGPNWTANPLYTALAHNAICREFESGRQDLNLRPPGPQPGALPDCATPRGASVESTTPSVRSHANIRSIMDSDDLRKCYRCGELKAVDEFSWRRKARGQRDSFCRPCRSAYGKEHYAANRQRYIDQARVQKQRLSLERTGYLIEYFVAHPCVDCGETDPVVLEFDHLRDKRFAISSATPRSELADHPRRDREVRGGLCQLPPTSHRQSPRAHCARS